MNLSDLQIKEKIEEAVSKIKGDNALMAKFKSEPVKTLEGLLGVDLPDEAVEKIVSGVKAKLNLDKASNLLGGLGGLFGKK